ncbi:hypothetical protein KC332_g2466 [Hortaea werneckii]|uniref:BTB domain-containing protein n=1 Tax=Hortaea werneckii EXF-2000 TaxID=1157616 RepID=A0A1Z5T5M4_HORWE|nr:hypothetical protein KC358_g2417 [Hortaea werneckii]OTA31357.1 hypothetical protein BTJ68_08352 [Hortaea werneckii EXF-2000]KAI6850662.1 hypothetical protein KC350_g2025 [Hortaea werneckii]KAI6942255.1 hypothetical protein KC341_g2386 [Hortaea werneckii]KAI6947594.1 hypothetical protein KC348_g2443 [Hortaea werneckii]
MEEVKAFASHLREQDAATVIVDGAIIYSIPHSLLDKLWPRCPSFCERLMLEVDKNGSFHIQTRLNACEVFEIFLFWAAEKRLPCLDVPKDDITEGDISTADYGCNDIVDILADLWLFAQSFSIPKLQNEAMRKLLKIFSKMIVGPVTLMLFCRLHDESQLKTVLLLEVAHHLCCDSYVSEDMDAFAKLDGFLSSFAGLVRGDGMFDPKKTSPSGQFINGGDDGAFMVPEE